MTATAGPGAQPSWRTIARRTSAGRQLPVVADRPYQGLQGIVDHYSTAELDDDQVTALVISELQTLGDEGWRIARAVIRSAVADRRRYFVRRVEQSMRQPSGRRFTPGDGTVPAESFVQKLSLDQLREFVGQTVKIPGNGPKAAENVTIAEWGIRMAALSQHANDTLATVALYRAVVHTLSVLKVSTIAEALAPERKRGRK